MAKKAKKQHKKKKAAQVAPIVSQSPEKKINCPECDHQIVISQADLDAMENPIGEITECDTCFCELEITALEPHLKVRLIEEEK